MAKTKKDEILQEANALGSDVTKADAWGNDAQKAENGEAGQAVDTPKSEEEQKKEKRKAIIKEIFSWVKTIVLAFLIALFLNHYVIVNANVPTGSMLHTIEIGDRLIGNRLAYKTKSPQRGDIIMFQFPLDESQIYIKRLIGLPGEHIEIRDGKVYIDGNKTPLKEDYLWEEWVEMNDDIEYDIPEGYYFMMGDNRNNSLDSRYWARYAVNYGMADTIEEAIEEKYCFVSEEQILGKAIFRYFPSLGWMNKNPY